MTISFAQHRMWFLNRYNASSPIYNIAVSLHFPSGVDLAVLRTAFHDVLARHDVLRTTYRDVDGEPEPCVQPANQRALPWFDLGTVNPTEVSDLCTASARICFNLAKDLPIRAHVIDTGQAGVVMCLVVHHIACDGASLGIVADELVQAYASLRTGVAPEWDDPMLQYVDYAEWQRAELGDEDDPSSLYNKQLSYWRDELAGLDKPIALPFDRDRPERPTSRGANVVVQVPSDILDGLRSLSHDAGSSEAIVFQSALAATLSVIGGNEDVALGAPIAGRVDEALEGLIGFLANTWVLRLQIRPNDSFSTLLASATAKALAAYDRQDLPFERVVEVLSPERGLSHPPLFQVASAWQSGVGRELVLEGETINMQPVHTATAKFELLFNWMPHPDGSAVLDVEYATDLFDEDTARWLVEAVFEFIRAAVQDPSQSVAMISLPTRPITASLNSYRNRALYDWNATEVLYPDAELIHLPIERQAVASPDAVAVRSLLGNVTFQELNEQANAIAWELKRQGVGPETFVGVSTERSPAMVSAVLGILKAGGAYLPIGTTLPTDRVAEMVASTCTQIILVSGTSHEWATPPGVRLIKVDVVTRTPSLDVQRNPTPVATADNSAYVIFTSGSTGRPKGVQVTHRPVHNLICWCRASYGFSASDVGFCVTSLDFDLSVFDIFGVLGAGGSIYVADYLEQRDPELQLRVLLDEGITYWNSVPGTLYRVLDVLNDRGPLTTTDALRLVYLSGDFTPLDLPDRLHALAPCAQLVSLGGATEATVWSNHHDVVEVDPAWRSIPYGRPIANARYYVLDDVLEPCRPGTEGDLYIGGEVLALGYAGAPGLSASHFVSDPFGPAGARMYRTGDRASYFEDGIIAIHGRADGQVKIRGFRVELGEIEHALNHLPDIAHAIVSVPKDEYGERQVIAHVVPDYQAITGSSDVAQHVVDWEVVYDQGYDSESNNELGEDYSLWTSSYTGEPIHVDDMREWRDAIVERILASAPERVLEIGVGTGLILSKIAPYVGSYHGTDVSSVAIARLTRLKTAMPWSTRVELSHQPADDPTGLPTSLDAIVINSVVQYFPHADYLREVLDTYWSRLAPGGVLVIGDVRRRWTYRTFQTAVQHARAPHARPEELMAAVMQAEFLEKELLVDPEFFVDWASVFDNATVDVRLKDVGFVNELSRHRYDVLVHKAKGQSPLIDAANLPTVKWNGDMTILRSLLASVEEPAVIIRSLADATMHNEISLARSVGTEESADPGVPSVDRVALRTACRNMGWHAVLTPAPEGIDLIDIVLVRAERGAALLTHGFRPRTGALRLVNNPSMAKAVGELPARTRDGLAKILPGYMIPSAVIPIPSVPLTENGKIDRAALRNLAPSAGSLDQNATEIEAQIARIYESVLGLSSVSLEDNFFEIGGHSLLATRVASRVREEFGVEVPIRLIFDAPTVREFASHLSRLHAGHERVIPQNRTALTPASYAQRRLWFLDRFEGPSPTYVIPFSLRLRGPVDREAMRAAVVDVVSRHEALRTVFVEREGNVYQQVLDIEVCHVPWTEQAVSADQLSEALSRAARMPFSLDRDLPIRADYMILRPDDAVLLLSLHHIAADGWSLPNLSRDLSHAYKARRAGFAPQWEPLPVQYADYSLWQQRVLKQDGPGSVRDQQLDYWREALRDLPDELPIRWDHPRPDVSTFQGRTVPVELSHDQVTRLRRLCLLTGSTMSMALHASLAAVLSRLGAGDDVPLGAPIAGRTDESLEPLVGFFVNTWVARVSLANDPTLMELLERVKRQSLDAYANQDIPFEYLVDELNPSRSTAHHPLFQVCLALQNNLRPQFDIPGLEVTHEPVEMRVARFDLFFNLFEEVDSDGLASVRGEVEYSTDILEPETVARLIGAWKTLLDTWLASPDTPLSSLSLVEGQPAITLAAVDKQGPTLAILLENAANRTRHRAAIRSADGTAVTFEQLFRASDSVAEALVEHLGDSTSPIVIDLPRSSSAIATILAAVRLGVPFIITDPTDARGWTERIIQHLNPAAVVDAQFIADAVATGASAAPSLSNEQSTACFVEAVTPDGQVLLVGLSRTELLQNCQGPGDIFRLGTDPQRVICSSSLQTLAGVLEVFSCLLGGHEMVLNEPSNSLPQDVTALFGGPELYEMAETGRVSQVVVTTDEFDDTRARAALDRCPDNVVLRVLVNLSGFALVPLGAKGGETQIPSRDERVTAVDTFDRPLPNGFFGELIVTDGWADRPVIVFGRSTSSSPPCTGDLDGIWRRTGRLARLIEDGTVELLSAMRSVQVTNRPYPDALVLDALEELPFVEEVTLEPLPSAKGDRVLARITESVSASASSIDEYVERWKSLYESLYQGASAEGSIGSDFRGWVRRSNRQPIPIAEMETWRDATVERIRGLHPRRALEIGAGTGLLAAELAGDVKEYWATDVAMASIERLQELGSAFPDIGDRLVLRRLSAHECDCLPSEHFDTIILNSVIQYFPHTDYLRQVLRSAVNMLMPGGSLFIGDVRSLDEPHSEQSIRPHRTDEYELLVSPEFFHSLRADFDNKVSIAIHLKRGNDDNELTAHRYDVIIVKEPTVVRDVSTVRSLRWGVDINDLNDLRGAVHNEGSVRLSGLLNRRRLPVGRDPHEALDPEDQHAWGAANGIEVACTWSAKDPTLFDAVFMVPRAPEESLDGLYLSAYTESDSVANNPLRDEHSRRICGAARRHLSKILPRRWIPERIESGNYLVTNFRTTREEASFSPLETEVARLFTNVLEVDSVGPDDDFFDLGGSSLQVIRLVWLINEELGIDVPVRVVFEHATVHELACHIGSSAPSLTAEDPTGSVLPIRSTGKLAPLWLIPPGGGLGWAYLGFATQLDRERPVLALQARGFHGEDRPGSMSEVVRDFARQIVTYQPKGPYNLAGWSLGGPIAHAVAAELQFMEREVRSLFVFDAGPSTEFKHFQVPNPVVVRRYLAHYMGQLSGAEEFEQVVARSGELFVEHSRFMTEYASPSFAGDLTLFVATVDAETKEPKDDLTRLERCWESFVQGTIHRIEVNCAHNEMMWPKNATDIAHEVNRSLGKLL
ncbi:non-ribosomal peptide synthetase [Actinomyces sp. Marseille-P3109]|uniref:non-ribosomal peptide synthetase n=1 Tax=Actinomyces sp. Marseille-P3109 TaxID=2083009 RepID=UPI000D5570D6|nr:non-ribosomal peptide synthetase [Actinomyces sp. Marseille-P3109]